MHLFDLKAFEKEGLESTLSDLALNVLYLISFAASAFLTHEGINPHFRRLIVPGDPEHTAGRSGSPKAW